ncbi:hypothetical protein Vadar_022392 [Vaccinium darrowii]|uniref:Uncharacterized protein n=1 Tax=Vaccinium darrowii TaxID=229202 RepID=A0ACB7YQU9_9ERIC|nr:hypothetical protein Vadar_022392 [Vaccinium darrowii]
MNDFLKLSVLCVLDQTWLHFFFSYELLIQRQQQTHDRQPKQFQDLVRRLDEVLYRNAASKEEYMSLETLETRLHVLIERSPISNRNQQHPQLINSASPIATMIPTPRMTHSGNLMVTSAVDASMVASSGGTGIARATSRSQPVVEQPEGPTVAAIATMVESAGLDFSFDFIVRENRFSSLAPDLLAVILASGFEYLDYIFVAMSPDFELQVVVIGTDEHEERHYDWLRN